MSLMILMSRNISLKLQVGTLMAQCMEKRLNFYYMSKNQVKMYQVLPK